jgi:threonine/homoserine/homoserine lactone efflux protein
MMTLILLILYGILAGVFTSIPAGPITILIVTNTLSQSRSLAYKYLLGLLLADLLYIFLFAFGIDKYLLGQETIRQIFFFFGSLFLIYLGFSEFRKAKKGDLETIKEPAKLKGKFAFKSGLEVLFAFFITLSNPAIFLTFAALIISAKKYFSPALVEENLLALLLFIELGATCWFLGLILVLSKLGSQGSQRGSGLIRYFRFGGSLILILFGLYNIINLVFN